MPEDVYDENYLESMMDDDQMTTQEVGIMYWYDKEADRAFETMDAEPPEEQLPMV